MSYEYKNFMIVLSSGDWIIYGNGRYVGKFDTSDEAENFIDREF